MAVNFEPHVISLPSPLANRKIILDMAAAGVIVFGFQIDTVDFQHVGDDLILTFPNGGILQLQCVLAQERRDRLQCVLLNGTVLKLSDILQQQFGTNGLATCTVWDNTETGVLEFLSHECGRQR